jgi:hypothetical protein
MGVCVCANQVVMVHCYLWCALWHITLGDTVPPPAELFLACRCKWQSIQAGIPSELNAGSSNAEHVMHARVEANMVQRLFMDTHLGKVDVYSWRCWRRAVLLCCNWVAWHC